MAKDKKHKFVQNTEQLLKSKTVRNLLNKLPDVGNKGGVLASIMGFLNLESYGGASVKGAESVRGAFQQAASYVTKKDLDKANALLKEVGSSKRFRGNALATKQDDLMDKDLATAMFVVKHGSDKKFIKMFSSNPEEAYKKYQQGSEKGYDLLKRGYKKDPTRLDLAHGLVRIRNQVSKEERPKVLAALEMLRGRKGVKAGMPKKRGATKPTKQETKMAMALLNKYDKFTKEKTEPMPGQVDALREAGFPAYSGSLEEKPKPKPKPTGPNMSKMPEQKSPLGAKEIVEVKKAAAKARAEKAEKNRSMLQKMKRYFQGK